MPDLFRQGITLRKIEMNTHISVEKTMLFCQPDRLVKSGHIGHQGSAGDKGSLKAPENGFIDDVAKTKIIRINNYLIQKIHNMLNYQALTLYENNL